MSLKRHWLKVNVTYHDNKKISSEKNNWTLRINHPRIFWYKWKHPSRAGVLIKRYSENIQKIYRNTPMQKIISIKLMCSSIWDLSLQDEMQVSKYSSWYSVFAFVLIWQMLKVSVFADIKSFLNTVTLLLEIN